MRSSCVMFVAAVCILFLLRAIYKRNQTKSFPALCALINTYFLLRQYNWFLSVRLLYRPITWQTSACSWPFMGGSEIFHGGEVVGPLWLVYWGCIIQFETVTPEILTMQHWVEITMRYLTRVGWSGGKSLPLPPTKSAPATEYCLASWARDEHKDPVCLQCWSPLIFLGLTL